MINIKLEEDLCCPVCHEIYTDPVIMSCSHSFCKACLQSWWAHKEKRDCPLCKRRSTKDIPSPNLRFKLFCLDHQELLCVVCRDSEKHIDHRCRPIDEAAQQHREELEEILKPSKERLKLSERVKVQLDQTAAHIKVQARHTERQIKEQFKKLHQFLAEEEEARMAALREEEEQKTGMMKEKMEALSREIADLSDTVRTTEEQLRAEDVSFLGVHIAGVDWGKKSALAFLSQTGPQHHRLTESSTNF
uniref:Zinc-binding protein A33-like n=1 Tax=Acanthochromis polyacanthus TaxID=80966 RepID=A0A3Q1FWM1_9TELE